MGNNPICTSVEQAQALISKGLTEDTADMYCLIRKNYEPRLILLASAPPKGLLNQVLAWSLAALINLLPEFIDSNGKDYCLILLSDRVVYWDGHTTKLYETTERNLINAVVNTILWLLDKNYI